MLLAWIYILKQHAAIKQNDISIIAHMQVKTQTKAFDYTPITVTQKVPALVGGFSQKSTFTL